MSINWDKYDPSPIEFMHATLIEGFHEWRKSKTENTHVEISGGELNDIITKVKGILYKKYESLGLDKAIPKLPLKHRITFDKWFKDHDRLESEEAMLKLIISKYLTTNMGLDTLLDNIMSWKTDAVKAACTELLPKPSSRTKKPACPNCGDYGWIDVDGIQRTCPCHY